MLPSYEPHLQKTEAGHPMSLFGFLYFDRLKIGGGAEMDVGRCRKQVPHPPGEGGGFGMTCVLKKFG
jgi:hypothetical protein